MLVGSMRVSSDTDRQTTDLQRDALLDAGVDPRPLFADKASGAREDRPSLPQALASLQPGDGLIVWTLDRLGRSLPHLLPIVTTLQAQVDITKVQELLGHFHVTTTQIYEKRRFHTSEGASHDFPISCCAPPLPRELGGAAPYDTKT